MKIFRAGALAVLAPLTILFAAMDNLTAVLVLLCLCIALAVVK